jgi:hypothetical protein
VSAYAKAARFTIRMIAAGFIVLSLLWYGPDLYSWLSHLPVRHPAMLVFKALPFVAGVVLYWKSDDIANWLTRDLD